MDERGAYIDHTGRNGQSGSTAEEVVADTVRMLPPRMETRVPTEADAEAALERLRVRNEERRREGTGVSATGGFEAASAEAFKLRPQFVERIAPLEDRLVVRPDRAEEMIGSFYVPDVAQQRPARGLVVAIGPDVRGIEVGDRVVYGHFTGTEVLHYGEEMLLMRQADVHAKLFAMVATEVAPTMPSEDGLTE